MFQLQKACGITNTKNKKFLIERMFGAVIVNYYIKTSRNLAKSLVYND